MAEDKWLGIADGFKAIWIEEDREQLKGEGKDKDILRNLQFTRRYIKGKNVVLLDDVLTTGESFRQLKRKMEQLGALFLFISCLFSLMIALSYSSTSPATNRNPILTAYWLFSIWHGLLSIQKTCSTFSFYQEKRDKKLSM